MRSRRVEVPVKCAISEHCPKSEQATRTRRDPRDSREKSYSLSLSLSLSSPFPTRTASTRRYVRSFYNDQLGPFCEKLCTTFDYERALPMNTGAPLRVSSLCIFEAVFPRIGIDPNLF